MADLNNTHFVTRARVEVQADVTLLPWCYGGLPTVTGKARLVLEMEFVDEQGRYDGVARLKLREFSDVVEA